MKIKIKIDEFCVKIQYALYFNIDKMSFSDLNPILTACRKPGQPFRLSNDEFSFCQSSK